MSGQVAICCGDRRFRIRMKPLEDVRLLSQNDVPAAQKLSDAAGWNQTEADWNRVVRLAPELSFGQWAGGVLVATTTAVSYGVELAWVGMVLTEPAWRGRGLARRLMERALGELGRRGVRSVKLDATEMGRPLYLSLGFREEGIVWRWRHEGGGWGGLRAEAGEVTYHLDQVAFGVERRALLEDLAGGGVCRVGDGFAMGRAGRVASFFGPAVATGGEGLEAALEWHAGRFPGQAVFWDIPEGNRGAEGVAERIGFVRQRRLTRMVLGEDRGWRADWVQALAGFEFG